jgi:hypothetical protein
MVLPALETLAILTLLFGAAMLIRLIDQCLARRFRWGHIRTMVVTFATIGLVIPVTNLVGVALKSELLYSADSLWLTSGFLMAAADSDQSWSNVLWCCWAILTNMLLYGIGGWIVGGVWQLIHDHLTGE